MTSKALPSPSDGYLRDWLVLGSFTGNTPRNMWKPFIREGATRPSENAVESKLRWRRLRSPDPVIDFMRDAPFLARHSECCAYCHVYLHVPTARQVNLLLGSDDGIAVWVNGQRVFLFEAMRACVMDENIVPVELVAGYNRILVKVTQYGGAWAFAVRVLSISGTPLTDARLSLDDPLKGKKQLVAPSAPPLALGVRYPDPGAMVDAPRDSSFRLDMSVLNVAAKATGAATIEVRNGKGTLAEVPCEALRPMQSYKASVTLPLEKWSAAAAAPLTLTVKARQRSLSAAVKRAPDAVSAFLLKTGGGIADLSSEDNGRLSRVRTDLSTGPELVAEHATIAEALTALMDALGEQDASAVSLRLREIDEHIALASANARKSSVYLAGHAHIDMNWLWRWPETVQACRDTFRQALRFMEEFPDFRLSQSQASVYEAMEHEDPALFEGIQKAVRNGAWEVTGGMWTEGDTNLSSGEALCRSFLLAQRYFRAKLGTQAKVGWLPDNFGHCAQLPQMLRLAGIDCFYHMRCSPPAQLYWWEGIDGSRVLAKTGQGYNDQITPALRSQPQRLPPETPRQLFIYGVGNHGGGPTRRDIETARRLQKNRLFPEIKFATAGQYFTDVRPLADHAHVHKGELQFIFEGCYTSVSRIKQGNRDLENALQGAEALSVFATLFGQTYPTEEIRQAWKVLVFNQFHDILPGSAIHESNADSVAGYQRALESCRVLRLRTLRFIGEKIGTSTAEGTIPLLVFNPLAFERTDLVMAEIVLTEPASGFVVKDRSGQSIAAQVVRTRRFDAATHYWIQFLASSVPGLGYDVFTVEPSTSGEPVEVTHWSQPYQVLPALSGKATDALVRRENRVQNRFFSLEISEKDGSIRSLRLARAKKLGPSLVGKSGANRLAIFLEKPNSMSAWTLDPSPEGPIDLALVDATKFIQQGPESISWVNTFRYKESTFALTTTVHADSPRIDCRLTAEWVERGTESGKTTVLRLLHHLSKAPAELTCDVPFAAIEREAGREVPAQKWASVRVRGGGLALLNRGKYGHSVIGGALGLTLLRASFFPDVLPDVGRHELSWALLPHETASTAELARAGLGFNVPFETHQLRPEGGALRQSDTLVTSKSDSFVVTGIKMSEDGDGIVIRGYEVAGQGGEVTLALGRPISAAIRTNILEQRMEGPDPKITDSSIIVETRPWEIVTLKVRLR
jgi:alpha-mannosidase